MKLKNLFLLLATFVVATPVYAFGVSTPYWAPNYPLEMEPGQTTEFVLTLQNMVDPDPVSLKVEWVNNGGIAQFTTTSSTITVPPGSMDVTVPIMVTVPAEAAVGTEYLLHIRFIQVAEGEGGAVAMSTGVEKIIPVSVVAEAPEETPVAPVAIEKEPEMSNTTLYGLLAIIVIILFAIFFFGKKKK